MNRIPEEPSERASAPSVANLGPEHHEELKALGRDLARLLARRWRDRQAAQFGGLAEPAPAPARTRARRPNPARLAKWEAQWQAEQDADGEAES